MIIIISWSTLYVITVSDNIRSGEQTRSNNGSALELGPRYNNLNYNYSESCLMWSLWTRPYYITSAFLKHGRGKSNFNFSYMFS